MKAVIAAVVVAIGVIAGVWLYIQSTPLETCIRSTMMTWHADRNSAEYQCSKDKPQY